MKRLRKRAAVAGGAAFALHLLAGKARKMRDHYHEMMAGPPRVDTHGLC